MNIRDFAAIIPEEPTTESLMSIESVVVKPAEKLAIIRCHMASKFRLNMAMANPMQVTLSAPGVPSQTVGPDDLLAALSRMIYGADEAIAQGRAESNMGSPMGHVLLSAPAAPDYMDLPTWDADKQRWYDAER